MDKFVVNKSNWSLLNAVNYLYSKLEEYNGRLEQTESIVSSLITKNDELVALIRELESKSTTKKAVKKDA